MTRTRPDGSVTVRLPAPTPVRAGDRVNGPNCPFGVALHAAAEGELVECQVSGPAMIAVDAAEPSPHWQNFFIPSVGVAGYSTRLVCEHCGAVVDVCRCPGSPRFVEPPAAPAIIERKRRTIVGDDEAG